MYLENLSLLASMNVTEFRAFKRALRTLNRCGITYDVAVEMLLEAKRKRESYRLNRAS